MKNTFRKLFALLLALAFILTVVACADSTGGYMSAPMDDFYSGSASNEEYTEIVENPFVNALETPDSYFSIDVNTASYPNLRNKINNGGGRIDKDAVRIEEMLNYFTYDYELPTNGDVLALTSSVFDTPYNENTKLMTIGLAAQEIKFESIQNNIVLLIDVSGSMNSSDKLPLLQEAFSLLVEYLNDNDTVSIVTYASGVKTVLKGAYGYEKQKIVNAINSLSASGSTSGSAGIQTAYSVAKEYFVEGGNNRVVLATDGDFNVGVTSISALEALIEKEAKSGVYFSVFGFGTGNLKADIMESLALHGNGAWGYIDSMLEAKRLFVDQLGGTIVTVAKDVKAGVTFNPEYVESYRLIGYENKRLTQDEFEDSNTTAGTIGSGYTLTVVYEIVLTDKEFVDGESFAEVTVKYKPTENVGGDAETEEELSLAIGVDKYHETLTKDDQFIAAVVEFGLVLRDSQYKGNGSASMVLARLANFDFSDDEFKEDFVKVVERYIRIYTK